MDRAAIQTHLDHLFHDARNKYTCPTHVCWFENTLHIVPIDHTLAEHRVFKALSYVHRTSGLTTGEWDLLTNKIFDFIQEKESCQEPSER